MLRFSSYWKNTIKVSISVTTLKIIYGIILNNPQFLPLETGQNIKERRIVKAVNLKEYQYESGAIPSEWEGKTLLALLGKCMAYRPPSLPGCTEKTQDNISSLTLTNVRILKRG